MRALGEHLEDSRRLLGDQGSGHTRAAFDQGIRVAPVLARADLEVGPVRSDSLWASEIRRGPRSTEHPAPRGRGYSSLSLHGLAGSDSTLAVEGRGGDDGTLVGGFAEATGPGGRGGRFGSGGALGPTGHLLDTFTLAECRNYLASSGYEFE